MHLRHFLYDKGILKSYATDVPSVCIGNIGVGGTGKTPMTELVLKTIRDNDVPAADAEIYGFAPDSLFFHRREKVAVLSRGYKRRSKGFYLVTQESSARLSGDEPLQIKKKFPDVTVAVDADRVEGCRLLNDAEEGGVDIIVLDDAYQHRRIRATKNMVLTTWGRPYFKDMLFPFGRLRDLPSRAREADMIVVTKCPTYVSNEERCKMAERLGLRGYDPEKFEGVSKSGKIQKLLFSTIAYDGLIPVFPEGDNHYVHAKSAIVFTGIANDMPLQKWLAETYQIVSHHRYPDHHSYTAIDMNNLSADSLRNLVSIVVTTEKDAQRLLDVKPKIDDILLKKMFYVPIRAQMLTAAEQTCLRDFLAELNN